MYVFELPFPAQKALSEILDNDENGWEQLASGMRLTANDIEMCRRCVPGGGRSRTSQLLRVWGSGGYTVDQLYVLLARAKHKRAMLVLNDYVDKKYHKLLDTVFKIKLADDESHAEGSGYNTDRRVSAISIEHQTPVASCASWKPSCGPSLASTSNNQRSVASALTNGTAQQQSDLLTTLQNTISIPYQELKDATDGFSSVKVVGKGGYGVVYKAEWKHTTVAVKRIVMSNNPVANSDPNHQASQQERERLRQSLMELKTLTLYRHDNILPLYGFSLDGADPCLVYQFMPGGSLEDQLLCKTTLATDGTALTWRRRLSIVRGSCRGLHFLHTISARPLIHGDVKSANILLDAHLEPKLGDFGLATTGQVEQVGDGSSPLIASHIKGTLAYLPPEFVRRRHVSTKLDVFALGVVLFEVATGMRAYAHQRTPHALADYVLAQLTHTHDHQHVQTALIDTKAGDEDTQLFWMLLNAGRQSCQHDPALRPPVDELLRQLDTLPT